ncbi:uncharacterized protein EV154DRAFT_604764 [Mucor mucedo]|uniref:uncharacterized protein n=1 Tax=Mucor mucedo TaxID=29922 RepID=UPI00221FE16E|nr:uncharacterized protein EV154DRAFT_604764 [Mucor mucedo]KAI7888451.1 hypothetical protein EV154DRAFT_604764 [Mucor mucedo]
MHELACKLVSTKIYCYSGGYASLGDIIVKRALNEHHYIDLQQTLTLDETSARWISIPDDPNFMNEPALAGTATSISDSSYMVDGGYNETPYVKNISRLFDTKANTWSSISNDGRNLSNNAIYMGTAVKVPNKGRIYYWGGLSGQYPGYPVNTTTVLSITSPMFKWSVCPSQLPLGTFTRFGHTATLDNDGVSIFYLGGRIRTTATLTDNLIPYNIIPMTKILLYNTVDATWISKDSPSAPTMSSRYMHSANLLPYSGKILIYGGATDDGNEKHPSAVSDYLYLFDPKTLEYTRMEEYEQTQGAGPRFGHSAILCNDTLFVLFGVNQKGLITNDVYFLSLSGSATWLKSYSMLDTNNGRQVEKVMRFSLPSIIGITIGSVLVVGFMIMAAIIYMMCKSKRRQKKEKEETVVYPEERYFEYHQEGDSATLHDDPQQPPRGFSYDHLVVPASAASVVLYKPNQVKDQQPLTFIEGQQQQSSTGSFCLQSTSPSTITHYPPLVKPSV